MKVDNSKERSKPDVPRLSNQTTLPPPPEADGSDRRAPTARSGGQTHSARSYNYNDSSQIRSVLSVESGAIIPSGTTKNDYTCASARSSTSIGSSVRGQGIRNLEHSSANGRSGNTAPKQDYHEMTARTFIPSQSALASEHGAMMSSGTSKDVANTQSSFSIDGPVRGQATENLYYSCTDGRRGNTTPRQEYHETTARTQTTSQSISAASRSHMSPQSRTYPQSTHTQSTACHAPLPSSSSQLHNATLTRKVTMVASPTSTESTKSVSHLELPLTRPCKGGCDFFGSEDSFGLCSKCLKKMQDRGANIGDDDVLNYLMKKCGFKDKQEIQRIIAFEKVFPDAAFKFDDASTIEGLTIWETTSSPVTQYDAIPIRGESACTFIAGVCALQCAWNNSAPDKMSWSHSIMAGVQAFHACKAVSRLGESMHRNIVEVLPFVLTAMGYSTVKSADMKDCFKEKVVGLLCPAHLSPPEFLEFLGPNAYPELGTDGLISAMHTIFPAVDARRGTSGTHESKDDRKIAIVVTRPPETYCVCRVQGSEKIYFRDSHRRKQFDFADMNVFEQWLRLEKSYFHPNSSPNDAHCNQVGLYVIESTTESDSAQAPAPTITVL